MEKLLFVQNLLLQSEADTWTSPYFDAAQKYATIRQQTTKLSGETPATNLLTDGLRNSVGIVERHESKILQHNQTQQLPDSWHVCIIGLLAFNGILSVH